MFEGYMIPKIKNAVTAFIVRVGFKYLRGLFCVLCMVCPKSVQPASLIYADSMRLSKNNLPEILSLSRIFQLRIGYISKTTFH